MPPDLVANMKEITLDMDGEPSLYMQLEFEANLPPLHYLPSPDRNVGPSSGTPAASYVVRQHQLTLDTCWNTDAADPDDHSDAGNIAPGHDESGNA
ncbi:hypothetical protein AZE42_10301 [Rhizopogon vesiculosus]|uniref:Uncharacterized protein n=1 Tax=Rhizopogon vesiculosus TaxID=180088 RepID=A0A1J8QCM9_9AGAM|nr:hypothetical protein AZE42_10301 [Rhizopogon vesiculosus]